MVPKHALKIIHNLLKQVFNNELLFGGKIFLFGGDFRQVLPIHTRAELVDLSLKGSEYWPFFKLFKLTKNMRANNSNEKINSFSFEEWILKIGNGELNDTDDYVEIPEQVVLNNTSLEEEIFKNIIANKQWDKLAKSAILASLNIEVDDSNSKVLEMFPEEGKIYYSIDEAKMEGGGIDQRILLDEYLHSLSPSSLPLHKLTLKNMQLLC